MHKCVTRYVSLSSLEKCCKVQQPSIECCIKQRKQLMINQAISSDYNFCKLHQLLVKCCQRVEPSSTPHNAWPATA